MSNSNLEQQLRQVRKKRSRKKIWHRALSGLMAITVFATTYSLILPAITMEKTHCGMEAHAHDVESGCYTETSVLTCESRDEGHSHKDGCYTENTTLICTEEECEGHSHKEACYDEAGELICETEEKIGHSHMESCWYTERELICGQEERERHTHEEGCYASALELTCAKQLHDHAAGCYADPNADVESEEIWKRTFQDVELTGVWADDVLAIAQTQLGYRESTLNYIVNENGNVQGYSRYGAWYGIPYGEWCAMFVSFCLNYAQVSRDLMPIEANCARWIEALKEENMYRPTGNADDKTVPNYVAPEYYLPVPGDLIFFDWKKDGIANHVGLVYEILMDEEGDPMEVRTIEGNSNESVRQNIFKLDDPQILGYGVLPENPEPEIEEEDTSLEEEPVEAELKYLVATVNGSITVTLMAPEDAFEVPMEELSLSVVPIEDKEAKELLESSVDADDSEQVYRNTMLFDITVMHGDEALQPSKPVTVNFTGVPGLGEDGQVYHVDTETEVAEQMNTVSEAEGSITMETPHFSVFGLTFTVDFHNGDLVFSIEGMSEVTLSTIFEMLNIDRRAENAVAVEFSDPELIAVEQIERDWLLKSLAPFDTEETLTITFNDGEIYVIRVTDMQVASTDFTRSDKVIASGDIDTFMSQMPLVDVKLIKNIYNPENWGNWVAGGAGNLYIGQVTQNLNNATDLKNTKAVIYRNRNGLKVGESVQLDESDTLQFTVAGAAKCSDGVIRDVRVTISGVNIKNIYDPKLDGADKVKDLRGHFAILTRSGNSAPMPMIGVAFNVKIEVMPIDTNDASATKNMTTQYAPKDIDILRNPKQTRLLPWCESITLLQGTLSKIYVHSTLSQVYLVLETKFDNLLEAGTARGVRIRADGSKEKISHDDAHGKLGVDCWCDNGTYNTGFAVVAQANFFKYRFTGTECYTSVNQDLNEVAIRPHYKSYDNEKGKISEDYTIGATGGTISIFDDKAFFKEGNNWEQNGKEYEWNSAKGTAADKYNIMFAPNGKAGVKIQTLSPKEGYKLNRLEVNGSRKTVSNGSYKLDPITANCKADVYYDPMTSDLLITKVDDLSGDKVKGAEFTLTGKSYMHGEFTLKSVPAGDGVYKIASVPYGQATDLYTLTETVVPDGYVKAPDVTLQGNSFGTKTVAIKVNEPRGACKLEVYKLVKGNYDETEEFLFTTTIKEGNRIYVPKTEDVVLVKEDGSETRSGISINANGVVSVRLRNKEKYVISNIPKGYTAVTEEKTDNRFTVKYQNQTGTKDGNICTMQMIKDDSVTFENTRKAISLTVKKIVQGGNRDDTFNFSVLFKDEKGKPVKLELPASAGYLIGTEADKYPVTFSLKDQQSVTITGIPVGVTATLTELDHPGYTVQINDVTAGGTVLSGTDSAEITLSEDKELEVINNAGITLPNTGGPGRNMFIFSGIALIAAAAVICFGMKLRRGRRYC